MHLLPLRLLVYVKSHTCMQFCSAGATINMQQATTYNLGKFIPVALNHLLERNLKELPHMVNFRKQPRRHSKIPQVFVIY